MNRANQIMINMKQLENEIDILQKELKSLQEKCNHEYKDSFFFRKCMKCQYVDVLYY
jgi:hypothetical protein